MKIGQMHKNNVSFFSSSFHLFLICVLLFFLCFIICLIWPKLYSRQTRPDDDGSGDIMWPQLQTLSLTPRARAAGRENPEGNYDRDRPWLARCEAARLSVVCHHDQLCRGKERQVYFSKFSWYWTGNIFENNLSPSSVFINHIYKCSKQTKHDWNIK